MMMNSILHILARSDTDSAVKLIFGVIVVVFWLIGALVSAVNKRAEENRRRAAAGQIQRGFPMLPQQAAPDVRLSQMTAPARVAQQRPAARRAAPAAGAIAAMPSANLSKATAATQVTRSQGAAKVVPPSQIGKLLKRPETLRAAFILNEVLSPPLSMREGPGGKTT
jgi:hypothetical protein